VDLATQVRVGPLEAHIERFKQGWRMVPRVPTDQMLEAARLCGFPDDQANHAVWRVMFDAFQNQVTD
jgi:hypothetical protein